MLTRMTVYGLRKKSLESMLAILKGRRKGGRERKRESGREEERKRREGKRGGSKEEEKWKRKGESEGGGGNEEKEGEKWGEERAKNEGFETVTPPLLCNHHCIPDKCKMECS